MQPNLFPNLLPSWSFMCLSPPSSSASCTPSCSASWPSSWWSCRSTVTPSTLWSASASLCPAFPCTSCAATHRRPRGRCGYATSLVRKLQETAWKWAKSASAGFSRLCLLFFQPNAVGWSRRCASLSWLKWTSKTSRQPALTPFVRPTTNIFLSTDAVSRFCRGIGNPQNHQAEHFEALPKNTSFITTVLWLFFKKFHTFRTFLIQCQRG